MAGVLNNGLIVHSLGFIHIMGTKSNRILGRCSFRQPLKKKSKAIVTTRARGLPPRISIILCKVQTKKSLRFDHSPFFAPTGSIQKQPVNINAILRTHV